MKISGECTVLVSAWEGLPDGDPSTANLDPYMDPVGIWTIGYGRALRGPTGAFLTGAKDRKAAYAQYPGGITKATAVNMLAHDLGKHETTLNAQVRPGAAQCEFDAIVSFDFNTGGFASSTLRKLHLQNKPAGPEPSRAEILKLRDRVRNKQVGQPATIIEGFAVWSFAKKAFYGGLFCRRLAEWSLYSGASGAAANAFGARVRQIIAV